MEVRGSFSDSEKARKGAFEMKTGNFAVARQLRASCCQSIRSTEREEKPFEKAERDMTITDPFPFTRKSTYNPLILL